MNNPIQPCRDFIAIDVEYANDDLDICQIGIAEVRDLEIISNRSWLIQPPCDYYDEGPMRIHHITPEMTMNCGPLDQAWQEIQPILLPYQLWAHNARSVEQPVLVKNINACGYDPFWINVHDSRDLYQRPDCPNNSGNGLAQCCKALGIDFDETQHHDAEYDALKCAEIVIAYAKGQQPDWTGVPKSAEELRKQQQTKRTLHLGEFADYYAANPSGEEDVLCELSSTYDGAPVQTLDVFDKGDRFREGRRVGADFSRLNTAADNPLHGKRVCITGAFRYDRKEIEKAIEAMGAKKVPKPTRNTDAVILGTANVGFTKLIATEQQEANGHHLTRIVGDTDLEQLLYGDGSKFFK